MLGAERGVVLLEILAAVLILTVAGLSLVELSAAGTRATAAARLREREQQDEERPICATCSVCRNARIHSSPRAYSGLRWCSVGRFFSML